MGQIGGGLDSALNHELVMYDGIMFDDGVV